VSQMLERTRGDPGLWRALSVWAAWLTVAIFGGDGDLWMASYGLTLDESVERIQWQTISLYIHTGSESELLAKSNDWKQINM
jgi:hypothetical protein